MSEQTTASLYGEQFGGERMWGLKETPLEFNVSYLPQTEGWYILFFAISIIGFIILRRKYNHWKWKSDIRIALLHLSEMQDGRREPRDLKKLIRYASLKGEEKTKTSLQNGIKWTDYLNSQVNQVIFQPKDYVILDRIAYQKKSHINHNEITELLRVSSQWMRLRYDRI